jgi:glycosyltransferase involved in cell wall biosynthesis
MRILYLHPKSWIGEYDLIEYLASEGESVFVFEEDRNRRSPAFRNSEYFLQPKDQIPTLWYNPKKGTAKIFTAIFDRIFKENFNGRNLVHRIWTVRKAIRQFEPDVVVCSDGFSYGIPVAFLKRLTSFKAKLFIGYIGGDIMDLPDADYGKRRTQMTDWLIKQSLKADAYFRPISPLLERILLGDGAPKERIRMIPIHLRMPWGNIQKMRRGRKEIQESLRMKYQIDSSSPVVATLSGNTLNKGIQFMGKAWPFILKKIPACRWLVCGPVTDYLEKEVFVQLARDGIDGSVCKAGNLGKEEVFEHLAGADLNVNPTLGEGLNMVVVEAASVGTPSITSREAGIADWVEKYKAGFVISKGNPEQIADAVVRFFQLDRKERNSFRDPCYRLADEFRLERIADSLRQFFKNP